MATSESADKEDSLSLSLGLEFLIPAKKKKINKLKKRKTENNQGPCHRLLQAIINPYANFSFSEGKHAFSKP